MNKGVHLGLCTRMNAFFVGFFGWAVEIKNKKEKSR